MCETQHSEAASVLCFGNNSLNGSRQSKEHNALLRERPDLWSKQNMMTHTIIDLTTIHLSMCCEPVEKPFNEQLLQLNRFNCIY